MLSVSLLWIDEAHHLLRGGAGRDTAGALQTLKNLLQGDGAVAVILSGVHLLDERLGTDPETMRRYQVQLQLRPVGAASDERKRLQRFIQRCCSSLGLRVPEDPDFIDRIVFAQKNGLGRSIAFAKAVLQRAIRTGRDCVTLEDARRTWIIRGGDGAGCTPFDPGNWSELQKLLETCGWE